MTDQFKPTDLRDDVDPWPDLQVAALVPPEVLASFHSAFSQVALIERTMNELAGAIESTDPAIKQGAVESLAAVVKMLTHHREVMGSVSDRMQRLMGLILAGGKVRVEGVGAVRVSTAGKKRFDGPMILSALAARVADEVGRPDADGVIPPLAEVCTVVAQATAEAVGAHTPGFTGWRTGALGKHGVDLAKYTTVETGKAKMVVT